MIQKFRATTLCSNNINTDIYYYSIIIKSDDAFPRQDYDPAQERYVRS